MPADSESSAEIETAMAEASHPPLRDGLGALGLFPPEERFGRVTDSKPNQREVRRSAQDVSPFATRGMGAVPSGSEDLDAPREDARRAAAQRQVAAADTIRLEAIACRMLGGQLAEQRARLTDQCARTELGFETVAAAITALDARLAALEQKLDPTGRSRSPHLHVGSDSAPEYQAPNGPSSQLSKRIASGRADPLRLTAGLASFTLLVCLAAVPLRDPSPAGGQRAQQLWRELTTTRQAPLPSRPLPPPILMLPETSLHGWLGANSIGSPLGGRAGIDIEPRAPSVSIHARSTTASRPHVEAPTDPTGQFSGDLTVQSIPSIAVVFVDHERVGETPVHLPRLRAGSHVIRIDREGYESWTSAVRVQADTHGRVTATLQARPH